jgi:hypothetical protein
MILLNVASQQTRSPLAFDFTLSSLRWVIALLFSPT